MSEYKYTKEQNHLNSNYELYVSIKRNAQNWINHDHLILLHSPLVPWEDYIFPTINLRQQAKAFTAMGIVLCDMQRQLFLSIRTTIVFALSRQNFLLLLVRSFIYNIFIIAFAFVSVTINQWKIQKDKNKTCDCRQARYLAWCCTDNWTQYTQTHHTHTHMGTFF